VLVIVDIGSANSDRQNPDQDLAFRRSWNWTLHNSQIARRVQDRCGHRAVCSTRIAGRRRCGHGGFLAGASGALEGTESGLYYVTRLVIAEGTRTPPRAVPDLPAKSRRKHREHREGMSSRKVVPYEHRLEYTMALASVAGGVWIAVA
jgi:hypothetical protein